MSPSNGNQKINQTLDDEQDFFVYNSKKRGVVEKLCSCFYQFQISQDENSSSPIQNLEKDDMKPCGMFGEKTYPEVCQELKAKSRFKTMPGQGFISVIVKSGDDLR